MTKQKKHKRRVRARMKTTGENYTSADEHVDEIVFSADLGAKIFSSGRDPRELGLLEGFWESAPDVSRAYMLPPRRVYTLPPPRDIMEENTTDYRAVGSEADEDTLVVGKVFQSARFTQVVVAKEDPPYNDDQDALLELARKILPDIEAEEVSAETLSWAATFGWPHGVVIGAPARWRSLCESPRFGPKICCWTDTPTLESEFGSDVFGTILGHRILARSFWPDDNLLVVRPGMCPKRVLFVELPRRKT